MASGHSFETPLWRPLPLRHMHTPVSKPSWLRSFTGQFLFVHICAYLLHFFRNTSVAQTHADANKYMNTGSTRLTLLYLREHCRGHRYWSQDPAIAVTLAPAAMENFAVVETDRCGYEVSFYPSAEDALWRKLRLSSRECLGKTFSHHCCGLILKHDQGCGC